MLQGPVFLEACLSRSSLPRFISSSISALPPSLSYVPSPQCLSGLSCGDPLQIPQPSLALTLAPRCTSPGSPAQQPIQPGYTPTPFPPHTYQASFHLLAFAHHSLGLQYPFHLSTYQFHHPSWPGTSPTSQQPHCPTPLWPLLPPPSPVVPPQPCTCHFMGTDTSMLSP